MIFRKQIKNTGLFLLTSLHKKTFDDLSVIKIRMGVLKGKKMILNLIQQNGQLDTAYLTGYKQEKEETDLLMRVVQKGQTIWDIGIYRGFYTLLFSELTGPQGKVLAFDIDQRNCKVVNEVLRLNQVNNVRVCNFGLSNENKETEFISSPSSNSRLLGTFRGKYTDAPVLTRGESIHPVTLRTLDSLVEEFGKADLVKIDIDGAELFALDTADRIFENKDVLFTIESHNESTDQKITEFLKRNGCSVFSINENRFFRDDELFSGSTLSCKNREKLKKLLGVQH